MSTNSNNDQTATTYDCIFPATMGWEEADWLRAAIQYALSSTDGLDWLADWCDGDKLAMLQLVFACNKIRIVAIYEDED